MSRVINTSIIMIEKECLGQYSLDGLNAKLFL